MASHEEQLQLPILSLPDDGSREREVYARFGLAAYQAQTFEIGMVNLLFITGHERATGDMTVMDDRFDGLMKKTAGGLLTELAKAGHLTEDELEICRTALQVRNQLMHGFFFRHAADFMAPVGMQLMVDELDQAVEQLHAAYELLMHLVFRLEEGTGVTPEKVKTYMDALVEALFDTGESEDQRQPD